MADGKKSVLIYTDLIHTVEKLPDDKAGLLFKHFLMYVNDQDPETDDIIVQIAFEPIRQQLKRDLKKWDQIREKRSEAGKASAEARKIKKEQASTKSTRVKSIQQMLTKSTVSVNDNDNVNVSVNDKVINKNKIERPTFEEFKTYALEKEPLLDLTGLKNKFDAWEVNGWKNGNDKKIVNWKSSLLNTLQYLPKKQISSTGNINDVWKK